jgi:hypothetical protein
VSAAPILPLRLERTAAGYISIVDANGHPTCVQEIDLNADPSVGIQDTADRDIAFLERIVQCVNAHNDLVALLVRARKTLAWAIDGGTPARGKPGYIERPAYTLKADYDEALAVCAAIAKTTGSQP